MFVIVNTKTNQRAAIGAWLDRRTCEVRLASLKKTYPEIADVIEILEIE
jgi:hypothetical protein